MKQVALGLSAAILLSSCNGSSPEQGEEQQPDADSGFYDRERDRSEENTENLDKAADDIFGSQTDESSAAESRIEENALNRERALNDIHGVQPDDPDSMDGNPAGNERE